MDELKQLGCLFALDDFGSGLSSFAYLKSLDVDYLKIDGAFVKDMAIDPIDRAMVESIHNIGSVLKLKTIAEFVENNDILEALGQVGVDFAQGYGIARPRPLPKAGEKLFIR
jgi:EAL domain-containing protein (putative c-di-GMP-specific phosphodiesterase class I)